MWYSIDLRLQWYIHEKIICTWTLQAKDLALVRWLTKGSSVLQPQNSNTPQSQDTAWNHKYYHCNHCPKTHGKNLMWHSFSPLVLRGIGVLRSAQRSAECGVICYFKCWAHGRPDRLFRIVRNHQTVCAEKESANVCSMPSLASLPVSSSLTIGLGI